MPALLAPPTDADQADRARQSSPLPGNDEFIVEENVPIFPEHTVEAKDGRTLVFNYRTLFLLCQNCNRRIAATGDYAAIIIGHSPDPDLLQSGKVQSPPVVGFAGPFKMGLLGTPGHQKWCILARFRIFKDEWATVRKYPRRSPELWLMPDYDQMLLDPIALLGAETPRIDMGLLYSATVSRGGRAVLVEKYAAVAPAAGNVSIPSERYQGGSVDTDQVVQAVVAALDGLDWVQFIKQKMQAEQAPAAMGTAPAADVNAPPAPAPELGAAGAAAPGAPGAPPPDAPGGDPPIAADAPGGDAPVAADAPGGDAPAPPAAGAAPPATGDAAAPPADRKDADVEKNSAAMPRTTYAAAKECDEDDLEPEPGESVEAYRGRSRDHRRSRRARLNYSATPETAAERETYAAQIQGVIAKAVDAAIAPVTVQLKNVERLTRLEGLAREGYMLQPREMLEKLRYSADGKGVSDEEFQRTFDILVKSGNRVPLDTMIPVPETIERYSAQPGAPNGATPAHRAKTIEICTAASELGKTPSYEGTLRNVVGGKHEVALEK